MKKIRLRKQLRLAERRTDNTIKEALDVLESKDPPVDRELLYEAGVEIPKYSFKCYGILEIPPNNQATIAGFSNFAALGSPSSPPRIALEVNSS